MLLVEDFCVKHKANFALKCFHNKVRKPLKCEPVQARIRSQNYLTKAVVIDNLMAWGSVKGQIMLLYLN